jgi:16S rRNA (guanine966-N2)-methyltransferase
MRAPRTKTSSSGSHRFRIIGGEWRGRRLAIPDQIGVRPTPERVRETLFNWLQGWIEGARCLDLFSGSGALGIEALSRGAANATFVEADQRVSQTLRQHIDTLKCDRATLVYSKAEHYLTKQAENEIKGPFDLIFLDPPFHQQLIPEICQLLLSNNWLSPKGYLYLESESPIAANQLPDGVIIERSKQAGQVWYALATYTGSD